MMGARTALICLAAVSAMSPRAGGAGLLPACAWAGGSTPCTRQGTGGLGPLGLRGGGQWGSSSGGSEGAFEDEDLSQRGKRRMDSEDEEKMITFKPGQDMGTGSLRLVPKGKTPRVNKLEPIHADKEPAISITFGDPDKPPDEPSRFKKDWWTGCSREEIMDYIRIRAEERTPDASTKRELNEDLVWAAEQGDIEKIRRLVAAGAEINAGGAGGSAQWAALHHAARWQQTEAVLALLDLGARINMHTWGKWTALHFACATHNVALVKALVERGADLYAVNADGETPYDRAMNRCKEHLENVGYDEEMAADLKKTVNHIAPQLPRDSEGELPNMFQILGKTDTYTERLMADIKPRVETVGDHVIYTYSDEEIDLGEPFWKEELWTARENGKGEWDGYLNSESSKDEGDSEEEDVQLGESGRGRGKDQPRIEELSDSGDWGPDSDQNN